jgi:hypothetical protein
MHRQIYRVITWLLNSENEPTDIYVGSHTTPISADCEEDGIGSLMLSSDFCLSTQTDIRFAIVLRDMQIEDGR